MLMNNMISPLDITKASDLLRRGGLVAFPTETVYGLGGDATNEAALRKIFMAKERPFDHPLIVHLADINQLSDWARDVSSDALKLAKACWPGPLTMVLKKQPGVLDVVTGGQDTIGIRIPRHAAAQALLREFGGGIAAPSANRFTRISPTTALAVKEELGNRIDFILDGGHCEVGLESTIIDMSRDEPVILRPGMITPAFLANVLGKPIAVASNEPVRSPGMHHLHYAPRTKTQLVAIDAIADVLHQLTPEDLPTVFVVRSDDAMLHTQHVHWVKMPQDPIQYAHDLYRTLRSLDGEHFKSIIIEEVPNTPEWDAIRDRLAKASAPRS